MNHDPIDYEDQRQARDHYRAVNKLIGEEDIKVLDALLTALKTGLICDWNDLPEAIQDELGLLGDICEPEGIGANDEELAKAS